MASGWKCTSSKERIRCQRRRKLFPLLPRYCSLEVWNEWWETWRNPLVKFCLDCKKIRRFFSRYSSLWTLWRNMLRNTRSRPLGQKLSKYLVVHRCSSNRFAPSRRHRKSGLLLNRLWSLIHVHRSQKRSNALFLFVFFFNTVSTGDWRVTHSYQSCQLALFSPTGFAWSHRLRQGVRSRWIKGTYSITTVIYIGGVQSRWLPTKLWTA